MNFVIVLLMLKKNYSYSFNTFFRLTIINKELYLMKFHLMWMENVAIAQKIMLSHKSC